MSDADAGSGSGGETDADAPPDPMGDVYRVLGPDGEVVGEVPDLSEETFVDIYRDMVTARRFDERAISLQRQGRIGTYAAIEGQEASSVAATHALREDDPIFYQYREHGAVVARGFPAEYLAYWMGHESGTAGLADIDVFPLNIGIAAHIPHAVGAAMAFDYRGDDRVACAHFGDGATSEGDFHEALNFAGVFDAPSVFVCHNNQWAISIPREDQTASPTLAAKAEAYGFEGVRVDGMDPLAVYAIVAEAARKARTAGEAGGDGAGDTDDEDGPDAGGYGHRPTLIETVEYRFGAHTTADDPSVYRDDEESEPWRAWDPIPRMEGFLRREGVADDDLIESVREEADDRVAGVIDAAERFEVDPADMFADVYAETTPELERQREGLLAAIERHGEDAFLREE
ncbi:thiamine pyrophosphate-dependent dehydrogenase E1 component subunit alpha [Halobaculum sp. CBA1158]|uniref:thiamine pyrophosphate-dependent dehydrogenase E1 component subunit alpha n=1 Tax=Halobaculum sp. CBA1158 TaxID=2904243 RepID=UPI001F379E07|nr:thiamine pyrophosphate-dependent dehydrogenase E1 component subunit alpha [Halobaculum sp. CBA1158]UIP00694.1 thiamine pyrophosphate-dependent dehydrogenase E1 component subunit alpha [Halobaculum sp. CBA1158]